MQSSKVDELFRKEALRDPRVEDDVSIDCFTLSFLLPLGCDPVDCS